MQHILVHNYWRVELDVVWDTVRDDLPFVIDRLQQLIESGGRAAPRMSTIPSAFSLAIIAGGQSRRMGRDKAFVDLGGTTLIERVIEGSADLGQAETILITTSRPTTPVWDCPCTAMCCRTKAR